MRPPVELNEAMRNSIPSDLLGELKQLKELAAQANGCTPLGDPRREAGELFCNLAKLTIDEYGIPMGQLSLAMGLSYSNVRLHLSRRGHIQQFPSQKNYKGVATGYAGPGELDACRRGHEYSADNIEMMGGHRTCRTCRKASRKALRARNRAKVLALTPN